MTAAIRHLSQTMTRLFVYRGKGALHPRGRPLSGLPRQIYSPLFWGENTENEIILHACFSDATCCAAVCRPAASLQRVVGCCQTARAPLSVFGSPRKATGCRKTWNLRSFTFMLGTVKDVFVFFASKSSKMLNIQLLKV